MTRLPPDDRVAVGRSILLIIATASLTVACTSAARSWPGARQSASANHVRRNPAVWNCVEALRPNSPLAVSLKSGDRVEGAFSDLRADILLLTDPVGREFSVPRSEVQIVAVTASDDLSNGVLIGAGIGLGAALAILTGLGSGDGYVLPSAKWGAPLLLSSVGGLIGALIDRARKSEQLVCFAGENKS
jgi:hypothetical protein